MLPSSNPVVLVADDEPSMLELVAQHLKTLEDPQLVVIEASDGEQAWKLAREHLPDLVVLDVMMPGMSGWEVCRKIREDVALAHTGVVMLTGIGENFESDDKSAVRCGCVHRQAVRLRRARREGQGGPLGSRAAARRSSTADEERERGLRSGASRERELGLSKKSAKSRAAKKSATAKLAKSGGGKAGKASAKTIKRSAKAPSKTTTAAKAKVRLSNKSKLKPLKGETKMAAKKKAAKKTAKKAAKKTAKKKAK